MIRKIVIHSDNLKKLVIFADKGGTKLSKTDWELVKEIKSVKSHPLEIPFLYSHPTDKLRIVILDTSDDAAAARKEKAAFYSDSASSFRFGGPTRFYRGSYNNARIGEIEIYGYKSAAETAASNSGSDKRNELDEILE